MNICITGGLGYLGSKLTETLTTKGFDVSILDSVMYGNFLPKHVLDKVKVINTDIRNINPKGIEVIKGSDVIIHLAAIVGDPACDLVKDCLLYTSDAADE